MPASGLVECVPARPALIFSLLAMIAYSCLSFGADFGSGAEETKDASTLVWFQERERGTENYLVRMIANNRFLRIDDGEKSSGFVLFDRGRKTIYSVDHDNRSVLILSDQGIAQDKPERFELREEELISEGSPSILGAEVKVHRFYTNEQLCFEVASARGLLADTVEVLRDFHRALAAEQSVTVQQMPKDLVSDCDLSDMVLVPDRHLKFGFPVRQQDYNGKFRELRDFDPNFNADPRLFELPVGYRRVTTQGLRG